MLTFTLTISYVTTSNLPWFMDLTFQFPMQYCSLWHWTLLLSPITFSTGLLFLLCLHPFILSGVISPLISSSMLGTSILSFCLSYCSWGSQGKNTEVVCHSPRITLGVSFQKMVFKGDALECSLEFYTCRLLAYWHYLTGWQWPNNNLSSSSTSQDLSTLGKMLLNPVTVEICLKQ